MLPPSLGKPVFKQLRKGTRSCQECRRRKVKCKYAKDDDNICEPCRKFDRQCVKQGYRVNGHLKARIIRAESMAERLNRTADSNDHPRGMSNELFTEIATQISKPQQARADPASGKVAFLQLFETQPLTNSHQTTPAVPQIQTSVTFDDPNLTDRAKLLSAISHEPSIMNIFETTSSWWAQWRDQSWAQRLATNPYSLQDFVKTKLASEDAVAVTVGLLCLAMSLFLLRPGIDDGTTIYTVTPPRHLMDSILTVVDSVILTNAKYNDNADMVLATLLRGKLYAEDSLARKGTEQIQKALQIMQHTQLGIANQSEISSEDLHSQQQFVGSVFEMDRYMCMVFGLPYITDASFSDRLAFRVLMQQPADIILRTRALRRVAAIAAEKISDRNSTQNEQCAQITDAIAERLADAQSAMPAEWWNARSIVIQEDTARAFEMLISQMWFWTTKMFLFLPAMLAGKAPSARVSTSNYSQCLESARGLIRVFLALRQTPSLSILVCNCDDFMGVLAGTILLVGLMQASSSGHLTSDNAEALYKFEEDMDLVETLKDTYRYRACEQGGGIARQGLRVLETLTSFFEDPASSSPAESPRQNTTGSGTTSTTTTLMLPYFGTIHVQTPCRLVRPGNGGGGGGSQLGQMLLTPPESLDNFGYTDENAFDMVNWDEWNHFMFDAELNQEWNVGLV